MFRSWCIGLCLASSVFATTSVFESGVPATATTPYRVNGKVYARVYTSLSRESLPRRRCALVHGFGVAQNVLDALFEENSMTARGIRVGLGLQLMAPIDGFAYASWGEGLIRSLREQVCDEVVVMMQESVQSSLFDMTVRTERFLKEKVCDGPCALVGHSKGGAVVTQIALRCMDAASGESELGRMGCANISHIYTAAANSIGSGASAILLGAHLDGAEDVVESFRPFLDFVVVNDDSAVRAFSGAYEAGKTNPAWFDGGPLAMMGRGETVYERIRKNRLTHKGWFRAKFAASASSFPYVDEHSQAIGIGTRYRPDPERPHRIMTNLGKLVGVPYTRSPLLDRRIPMVQQLAEDGAKRFDDKIAPLHSGALRAYFDKGVAEFSRLSKTKMENVFTWERYQKSDGLVEAELSLAPCLLADPRMGARCRVFKGLDAVNHVAMSGGALEIAQDIFDRLLE